MSGSTRWMVVAGLAAALAGAAAGQQIENGGFEQGATSWTTNFGLTDLAVQDLGGNGNHELVFFATNLVTQYSPVILAVQDLPAEYFNLTYGVALAADIGATNLSNDVRAYSKLEFLSSTGIIGGMTLSGEYNPDTYAASNQFRPQMVLWRSYNDLSNQFGDIQTVRATLFMLRFDTAGGAPTGAGYFDNVSFGLVSKAVPAPGIINGGFEYDDWYWRKSPMSEFFEWSTRDIDGDGDKELEFPDTGLTVQYGGRLWVQEFDARMIDFSNGIAFGCDVGATNLADGFKAFPKLEFCSGAPPYGPGSVINPLTESGEYDPLKNAATNTTRLGVTLGKSYATITNQLVGTGLTVDDITFVRCILFLIPLNPSPVPAGGSAWFDNAHLDFTYRGMPTLTSAAFPAGGALKLAWQSETGKTYRVQGLDRAGDYRWRNLATNFSGDAVTMSYTNSITNAVGFLRVVRD